MTQYVQVPAPPCVLCLTPVGRTMVDCGDFSVPELMLFIMPAIMGVTWTATGRYSGITSTESETLPEIGHTCRYVAAGLLGTFMCDSTEIRLTAEWSMIYDGSSAGSVRLEITLEDASNVWARTYQSANLVTGTFATATEFIDAANVALNDVGNTLTVTEYGTPLGFIPCALVLLWPSTWEAQFP